MFETLALKSSFRSPLTVEGSASNQASAMDPRLNSREIFLALNHVWRVYYQILISANLVVSAAHGRPYSTIIYRFLKMLFPKSEVTKSGF